MTRIGLRGGAALLDGSIMLASVVLSPASAQAEGGRSVALVLDASGSMNAKLPDGMTRIDAAKTAVADLVGKLPGDTRLALRVYGHQSPTSAKNCRDTALLVPFGSVAHRLLHISTRPVLIVPRGTGAAAAPETAGAAAATG